MTTVQSEDARMTTVVGQFHTRKGVRKAVNALMAGSVPTDSISVHLLDDAGQPKRSLPVRSGAGTLKGTLLGAGIGAAVGVAIVALVPSGLFGPTSVDTFDVQSLAGAITVILMSAAAGVPLGALLGMGHWQGARGIGKGDIARNGATVTVESDALADRARQIFEEVGADRVSG